MSLDRKGMHDSLYFSKALPHYEILVAEHKVTDEFDDKIQERLWQCSDAKGEMIGAVEMSAATNSNQVLDFGFDSDWFIYYVFSAWTPVGGKSDPACWPFPLEHKTYSQSFQS